MTRVGGVIVTFWPDADFAARLAAIRREVSRLLVIDNTADAETHARLQTLCMAHDAELIANPRNLGLGAALNEGFTRIAADGCEWAIAFDQDSTPSSGFAAALLTVAEREPEAAVVGAHWADEARPEHSARHLMRGAAPPLFRRVPATSDLDPVTCVITSGSLFHLPTWRELGGFDAALFLDLVDTEYCLRAARAHRPVRVAAGAKLRHRRGAKRPVPRFGRVWWPAFMPPLRLRYLFRNRWRLARRYAWSAPHWCVFEAVYTAKILAEILLLEEAKGPKLAACLRGTWDGLVGRTGKIDMEKTSAAGGTP